MRKFLRIFFWSHGTLLGYLGSLSQKGHPEIFSKWFLINLSNPLRHPTPLVDPLLTKNLDTAGPWCEWFLTIVSYFIDMQTQQVDLLVTFGTIEWFLTILNSFMDILAK